MATTLRRPIHFLVRGDMFNPRFQWIFNWTNQIPIYRQKDGIANLRKNASSFDLTYRKLAEGEAVLIFPEAKSFLEKKMRPIQRGTAHLAFGTLPYLKGGEKLMVVPVGVNFTEPRLPGTDVVVRFGDPFASMDGSREDREAIDAFTSILSTSMDPLIIQVRDELEKNYDVLASIYLRMIYENNPGADAHDGLQKIASSVNNLDPNGNVFQVTNGILASFRKFKNSEPIYYPDLIVMNKVGLLMLALFKILWLIAGGWIWRVVRNFIFKKIKADTFQGPTTVGVFMIVMPLTTIILLIIFLIAGVPLYYLLIWLVVMWLGTLIRPSLKIILNLLTLNGDLKLKLKNEIIELRSFIEKQ